MPLFQEQIQKQLEHLKELRKSGEEQRSQGDKKTANFLVRPGVFCGQPLPEFTPAKGGRGPKVSKGPQIMFSSQGSRTDHLFRITCSWGGREVIGACPWRGTPTPSREGNLQGACAFSYSLQNGLEKLTPVAVTEGWD